MKKFKFIIITIILFIGMKNVYAKDSIYDYASVLTLEEEKALEEEVDKFTNKYNVDMALILVKYYTPNTIDEYMNEFHEKYFKEDSMILIVIDFKNNIENISIKTFKDAISLYSDKELNDMIKQINKKDGYYDKLDTFIKYSNEYATEEDELKSNILLSLNWLLIILVSFIIPSIIVLILFILHKETLKTNTNSYIKKDSVVITTKIDKYITTNTKKKRLNDKV